MRQQWFARWLAAWPDSLADRRLYQSIMGHNRDEKAKMAARDGRFRMAKEKPKRAGIPDGVRLVFENIVDMVEEFCREELTEEYAVLCRKLTEKLARKRPSPLLGGRPEVWACGIIRVIPTVSMIGETGWVVELMNQWAEIFWVIA